jgi:hypothetical protein
MFKKIAVILMVLLLACMASIVNAAMEATGNAAPIQSGSNVLSGVAVNDSAGSSDLTLIVQLKAGNTILVDEGSACKVIVPTENIPSDADPTGWTMLNFDDSAWQDAVMGIGYGDNDDNTTIGDGDHATVYTRIMFTIADAGAVGNLTLGVDYDDAAVIFINGVEVARTSGTDIPDKPEFDSWSDKGSGQSHEASKSDPPGYETMDLAVTLATAVQPQGKLAALWGDLKR